MNMAGGAMVSLRRRQAEADEAATMRDERWSALQARAGEIGVTVGVPGQ